MPDPLTDGVIVTTGYLRAPADQLASIKDELLEAVHAARAQPGNIAYSYAIDLEDPTKLHACEIWESHDAIAAHTSKPHFAKLIQAWSKVDVLEQAVKLHTADRGTLFGA